MTMINRLILSIITAILMGVAPMTAVWSADEDMISQVYLEFDPETGEFVTAQDPTLSGTSKHSIAQSKQIEQIQETQDQLAAGKAAKATADTTMAAAPAAGQQSMGTDNMGGTESSSTMLIAGILALGLLVGIVALVRKSQKTA